MPKPAEININLLLKDPFFETSVGRFLNWAIRVGRYIVIFTELVVIISFATRFTLDRMVTNLNKSIKRKETIIRSYGDLEQNFRSTQKRIKDIQQVQPENNITEIFPRIKEIMPGNIILKEMKIDERGVSLRARALTNEALNFFINNLQISPYFTEVNVNKIQTSESMDSGFEVDITAKTHLQLLQKSGGGT